MIDYESKATPPMAVIIDYSTIKKSINLVIRGSHVPDFVPHYNLMPGELALNLADDKLFVGVEDGKYMEVKLTDIPEPLQSVLRKGVIALQSPHDNLFLAMGPARLLSQANPCAEILLSEPSDSLSPMEIQDKKK